MIVGGALVLLWLLTVCIAQPWRSVDDGIDANAQRSLRARVDRLAMHAGRDA